MGNRSVEADELELVKFSYAEVLDAVKHQDDKVGRFLTALAFLTTGAITLLFRGPLLGATFEMRPGATKYFSGPFPIVAWLTAAFFIAIIIALVLFLASLSKALTFPGGNKDGQNSSLFYFMSISRKSIAGWQEAWRPKLAELYSEAKENLVNETHHLAQRAATKYLHMNRGAAVFHSSLFFLGLLLVFAIKTSIDNPVEVQAEPVVYGKLTALAVAAFSSAFAVALLLPAVRVIREKGAALWGLETYYLSIPVYISVFAFIPALDGSGWDLSVCAVFMLAALSVVWSMCVAWRNQLKHRGYFGVLAIFALLGGAATIVAGGPFPFLMVAAPVLVMTGQQLLRDADRVVRSGFGFRR